MLDCGISSANVLEIPQSCTKPWILYFQDWATITIAQGKPEDMEWLAKLQDKQTAKPAQNKKTIPAAAGTRFYVQWDLPVWDLTQTYADRNILILYSNWCQLQTLNRLPHQPFCMTLYGQKRLIKIPDIQRNFKVTLYWALCLMLAWYWPVQYKRSCFVAENGIAIGNCIGGTKQYWFHGPEFSLNIWDTPPGIPSLFSVLSIA